MKNFKSFFSTFLIFSIVLTNIAIFVLPVFAVEKNDINLEQNRINSLSKVKVGDQTATGTLTETNIDKQLGVAENKLKENILKDTSKLETKNYVEGEILVKYKNNKINLNTSSGRTAALSFNTSKSLEKKEDLKKNNISVLRIKDSKTVEQKIAELKNDPNIEYAQPNFQYYPLIISTNDTKRAELWGLDNTGQTVNTVTGTNDADIDAPEAWAINEGINASAIVAVIDNGVAYNHPDLATNMWNGANCVSYTNAVLGDCNHGYDFEGSEDKIPLPDNDSHGTHIAGIIAAVKDNNLGVTGVAPKAKIMALKTNYSTSQNIKAIDFAKYNGAKIINASWGDSFNTGVYSHGYLDQALYNAIRDFPGLFVAAAGNDGQNHDSGNLNTMMYPAGFRVTSSVGSGLDNIIVVAATDQNDNLANSENLVSDYGVISVDVGAPGVNIYSTVPSEQSALSLSEGFEGITPPNLPSGWIKTDNWGTFRLDSGTFWGNVLYGDYSHIPYVANANSIITLPSFNLLGSKESYIDFWTKCDTEYFLKDSNYFWTDYMTLELSSNGIDFTPVLSWNEASIDSNYPDKTGGTTYRFQNLEIPSNYYTSNFKMRFRWITDSSNVPDINYDGCLIDDLKLIKHTLSDGSDEKYDYMNGTSMAAPHVVGLAALIWGTKPSLTYTDVKNTILNTGDSLTSLLGKTSSGKRINAFNALDSITPPVITNIQVATTTETSTMVTWSTDLPATSTVYYSTTTPVSSTIVSGGDTATTSHNIGLTDLSPDTTYYFYTKSSDKYGNIATSSEQSFKTIVSPDTTKPVITLLGIATVNLTVGDSYTDAGATASDNVDGNITANIVTVNPVNTNVVGSYAITYNVTDAAGNPADQVARTVNVNPAPDTTKPVITLLGIATVNLTVGDSYTDAGATASDNVDGNITTHIITVNPVNTSVVGTYTVTYNVSDLAGNPATQVTRTVNVNSTQDITPPVLTSFDFSPKSIDISNGPAQVTMTLTATDDLSGVDVIQTRFTSPTGIWYYATFEPDSNGNYSPQIITIPQLAATGVYTIGDYFSLKDNIGNTDVFTYTKAHLESLGYPTELQVINSTQDITPPVLTLLGSTPVNLYVGDSYTDSGAIATDNVDGDITTNIIISNPVNTAVAGIYIVTYNVSDAAGNPADQVTRTVNVNSVPLSSAKDITSFSFPEGNGIITGTNIAVTVPYGTIVTALVPSISLSGGTISPLNGVAQNFTNLIFYTVTAADSSTQTYTVTVTIAPNTAANILSFNSTAPTATGLISGNNITLTVPFGTNLTDLPITITLSSGASINPVAGNTTFIDGVATTYTVTAQDNVTTQNYLVTVIVAANSAKNITSFNFEGLTPIITGIISGINITLNVPYGTDVITLVPTITITGVSVNPTSGVAQSFTSLVTYTVTAADTTTQSYTVTVIVAEPSDLTALTAAITTAQNKYNAAVEGNVTGQYPAPLKANLQIAINNASAITKASSQSVVDAAVITLNSAVTTFEAGIVPPDTTPPIITLNGMSVMDIYEGSTYVDAGATALDNVDGDITANIIVVVNPCNGSATENGSGGGGGGGGGSCSYQCSTVSGICYYSITYNVTDAAGNHAIQVTRTVNVLPVPSTAQLIGENITVSTSTPEIVVGDNNASDSIITIPDNVNNATINLAALTTTTATSTTATVQGDITINASTTIGTVNVEIPSGTQIVANTTTWNGIINVPQIQANSTVTVTPESGNTASVSSVIEIGFGDTLLTFNKAVRIKIAGQAGKYVGYSRNGVFTQITNICSSDSQTVGDALAEGAECKINVGSDLIIWTKHFTKFATYTQTATTTSGGGGGGGGGSSTPAVTIIKGDINKDGKVDKYDFALMMANWGKVGANNSDLNSDSKVDKYDFALLMVKWGAK